LDGSVVAVAVAVGSLVESGMGESALVVVVSSGAVYAADLLSM